MNVLLIGSGGREHALAWKLKQSPLLGEFYCAPGNPGIAQVANCVELDVTNHQDVVNFCRAKAVDFVVVGPEAPLVAGLVDDLGLAGIAAFGPSKYAAQLEGSKGFTKDICRAHNIPTAAYGRFDNEVAALAYLEREGAPIVIKADGLAAGKGVTVAMTIAQAQQAVRDIFAGRFGGASCVIEEFLEGEEASLFVLTDGVDVLPLTTAQDHKRVGDGDTGPNTGGMGAYSPAPCMTAALISEAMEKIVKPTVKALAGAGHPYKGVLYAGLILTKDGPKLIEYNARFGDPETQVMMMRMNSDLLPLLMATVDGTLSTRDIAWKGGAALTVVLAAQGYPGEFKKNIKINNLNANLGASIEVFHAGTKRVGTEIVSNGGRILNVTALAEDIKGAQQDAYRAVDRIQLEDGFCRRDIGWRAV